MKKTLITVAVLAIASSAFADKMTISGTPVVLERQGSVYYLPKDYSATTSYHYVTIGGANRVCYMNAQPQLASLNMEVINVNQSGKQVQWTCYVYDDNYFTVTH